MSAPARSSAWICATVASTSWVSVLVIDCTVIGASPPTGTAPTWICRHLAAAECRDRDARSSPNPFVELQGPL